MVRASLGDIFRNKLTGEFVKIVQLHTINSQETGKQHKYVVMDGVARPGQLNYSKWGVGLTGVVGALTDLLQEYEKVDRLTVLTLLGSRQY